MSMSYVSSIKSARSSAFHSSKQECFFCEVQHSNQVLYENELLFFVLDSFPVSPGHGLLVPKRHVTSLADLTEAEWHVYYASIKKVIGTIESIDLKTIYTRLPDEATTSKWFIQQALGHPRLGTKPDAYNHGLNDGTAAGRTVDHLHWHVIPRFEGDMDDPRGGVRYVRPDMGNYKLQRD